MGELIFYLSMSDFHTEWKNYKIRVNPSYLAKRNCYYARISVIKPEVSKCFNVRNYENKRACYIAAVKWLMKKERSLGVAKNMIRYLNRDVIEVQCEKRGDGGSIRFITDAKNIGIVLRRLWSCDEKRNIKRIKGKENGKTILFHREVTDFKYSRVGHINGIDLDNRISNLCDSSKGRRIAKKLRKNNTTGISGLYWNEDRRAWEYRWRIGNEKYREYFTVHQYGSKENAEVAIKQFIIDIKEDCDCEGEEKETIDSEEAYKNLVRECKSKRKFEELLTYVEKRCHELKRQRKNEE